MLLLITDSETKKEPKCDVHELANPAKASNEAQCHTLKTNPDACLGVVLSCNGLYQAAPCMEIKNTQPNRKTLAPVSTSGARTRLLDWVH